MDKCRTNSARYHMDAAQKILSVVEEAQEKALAKIKIDDVFDQIVHGDREKSLKIVRRILLLDDNLLNAVVSELLSNAGKNHISSTIDIAFDNAVRECASVIELEKEDATD